MRFLRRNLARIHAVAFYIITLIAADNVWGLLRILVVHGPLTLLTRGMMSVLSTGFVVCVFIFTYFQVQGFRGAWYKLRYNR